MWVIILFLQILLTLCPCIAQDYWVHAGLGGNDVDFIISGAGGFLYTGVYIPGVPAGHLIYRTSDDGVSWYELNDGLPQNYILLKLFSDTTNHVYAAVDSQLYRLSTGDTSWTLILSLGSGRNTSASASNSTGLVLIGAEQNIFKSTDYGENWEISYYPTQPNEIIRSIVIVSSGNFIASIRTFHGDSWVVRSTDGGFSWATISTFGYHFDLLVPTPTGSLLGIESSGVPWLFHSTDAGVRWTVRDSSLNGESYSALIFDSSDILYACGNGGVFSSENEGMDWLNITFNLPPLASPHSMTIGADGHIYLGTVDNGVWKSVQKITVVDDSDRRGYPEDFALYQNYPNPFNSMTTIEYELSDAGFVRLDIFNIAGDRIAQLVSEYEVSGRKIVYWDAYNQPSGIYFYRLVTTQIDRTRKLILLK